MSHNCKLEVSINGAEVLKELLDGPLKGYVDNEIQKAIKKYVPLDNTVGKFKDEIRLEYYKAKIKEELKKAAQNGERSCNVPATYFKGNTKDALVNYLCKEEGLGVGLPLDDRLDCQNARVYW